MERPRQRRSGAPAEEGCPLTPLSHVSRARSGLLHAPLILCALLFGCPKKAATGPVQPTRLTASRVPFEDVCISPVAEAPPPRGADLDQVDRALALVIDGLTAEALDALDEVRKPSPRSESLLAATLMLEGRGDEAEPIFERLLEDWPEDACLNLSAGLNAATQQDSDKALARIELARTLDPADANAALMWASLAGSTDPTRAHETMGQVFAEFPSHPGAGWWYGLTLLAVDKLDDARGPLEVALRGGMPVRAELAMVSLATGDLNAYLRHTAGPGLPLVDATAIQAADAPMTALYEQLGMKPGDTLWADLDTSMGPLTCQLFPESAPITVSNFVGLARGTLPWSDPRTDAPGEGALYRDLVFHRVIPGFMIQGGDPLGQGTGGPGYRFMDEIDATLRFDQPGRLAMANSGPATNGSQFFVTEVPTPHLDGMHTIFGQCDEAAVEQVKAIARVPVGAVDRPVEDVRLNRIQIRAEPPEDP